MRGVFTKPYKHINNHMKMFEKSHFRSCHHDFLERKRCRDDPDSVTSIHLFFSICKQCSEWNH